jgi:hypothetical protein
MKRISIEILKSTILYLVIVSILSLGFTFFIEGQDISNLDEVLSAIFNKQIFFVFYVIMAGEIYNIFKKNQKSTNDK